MKTKISIFCFIIINIINPALKAQISDEGLIAYYPFNGNANDESGNGNNGIVYGASLTTDRFGNPNSAYSFNGIDNYISVKSSPTLISPSNKLTMTGWAMISGYSFRHYIVDKRINFDTSSPFDSYVLLSSNTFPNQTWQAFTSSNSSITTGSTILEQNSWYFVAGVYDGTKVDLYVNGIFESSNPASGNISYSDFPLYIGAGGLKPEHFMNGKIDDIRIYNRVLTPGEILSLNNLNCCDSLPDPAAISGIKEVCQGQKGVSYIVSNMDSITNYIWTYSGNGATIYSNNDSISVDFTNDATSGILTVTGNKINGGKWDSAYIAITIKPLPVAYANSNSPVCLNNQINLSAQTISGGIYNWTGPAGFSSSDQNPVISYASSENEGTYALQISLNGCLSAPSMINVVVNKCDNGDLSIQKNVNNINPNIGQTIVFTIIAANNSTNQITGVTIIDSLQSGYNYISSTVSSGTYDPLDGIWTIGNLNSGASQILTIIVTVNSTGNYVNTAIIQGNLIESNLTNNISSIKTSPFDFNIPNSFSPNGDGTNDFFIIRGLLENSKLIIFNKLGRKVYESENYQNDWNGKTNDGERLDSDTYWYILSIPGIPAQIKDYVYLKN